MLFHLFDAHPGHVMAPGAEDAGREALIDEICEALVRRIEIFRANAACNLSSRENRLRSRRADRRDACPG